jgi:phage N-6-adenine-methyltransferase
MTTELLTITETETLTKLEAVIERGLATFVDVGNALLSIRDSKLYRESHTTFEDYCRERWQMSKTNANRLIQAAEVTENLTPFGVILPTSESQARPLTRLEPEEQIVAWEKAVSTASNRKITAAHVQSVVDEITSKPHVAYNSGNNEWYTPVEYIVAARAVMGDIELDPASSLKANQTVRAKKIYTAQDDGLTKKWSGRTWMNPPYAGELIGKFSEKIVKHYGQGDIGEAIVLVNNATETIWFQTLLECASAVCLIKGRIKFIDAEGKPSGAPLQGQALLYFGEKIEEFTLEFSKFGRVMYGAR